MKCPDCSGDGYVETEEYKRVKVWCDACKGSGVVKYEGDRSDISWERE